MACPFSVWIGRWFLGKDIREYGDGNPGAANVFRAGGRKSGCLALVLDVAKGVPFVALAHSFFNLSEVIVMGMALSAISGHAIPDNHCVVQITKMFSSKLTIPGAAAQLVM